LAFWGAQRLRDFSFSFFVRESQLPDGLLTESEVTGHFRRCMDLQEPVNTFSEFAVDAFDNFCYLEAFEAVHRL
jgi:hypothetical protein